MVRLTHSGKKAFQEFEKNFQILEKPQATETLEHCSDHLVNMVRPGNIRKSARYQNRNWRQGWRSNKLLNPRNFVPMTRSTDRAREYQEK